MINFLIGVLSVVSIMNIYVWFKETSDNKYNFPTSATLIDTKFNTTKVDDLLCVTDQTMLSSIM